MVQWEDLEAAHRANDLSRTARMPAEARGPHTEVKGTTEGTAGDMAADMKDMGMVAVMPEVMVKVMAEGMDIDPSG